MNDLKQAECEIRNMIQSMRNGKVSLYEIAMRCKVLLNNLHDYAEAVGISRAEVLPRLNALLTDSNVTVETLLTVLKHRPDRAQWTIGINRLLQEIEGELRQQQREDKQNAPQKHKATVKAEAFEAVQKTAIGQRQVIERQQDVIRELKAAPRQAVVPSAALVPDDIKRLTDALNAEKNKTAHLVARVTTLTVTISELRSQLATVTNENKTLGVELKNTRKDLIEARAVMRRVNRVQKCMSN